MSPPVAPLLWRSLRVHQVFGANTEVGKTVLSTILCRGARRGWEKEQTGYLKPVSTGPLDEADDRHIRKYADGVSPLTLVQYDQAVSPHLAAQGKKIHSDEDVLAMIHKQASQQAQSSSGRPGWLFIETAGGVHSPTPSGTTQADMYSGLRTPVVLIGDSKLGGISLTISAFESLRLRGYDVASILLFDDPAWGNAEYLSKYFARHHEDVAVAAVPKPPTRCEGVDDEAAMATYYREAGQSPVIQGVLAHLDALHRARVADLEGMAARAVDTIWYPFMQHKGLTKDKLMTIDSARGNFFQTLVPEAATSSAASGPNKEPALLQPSFDASASWWTQGLGHASPSLTMAAAYAAGRYGHVMFAGTIHAPALALAEALLRGLHSPRAARVFYTDNGSTGMEVAVKMALRATRVRRGWPVASASGQKLGIIGLKGAYHGDTMGVMDCAEPNTFNEKVEWYEGKGVWFDYPTVLCSGGAWRVRIPGELDGQGLEEHSFDRLADLFDLPAREAQGHHEAYERYILRVIESHVRAGRRFGALVLEPVVIGAGGMLLVDPLFQRTLVRVVRERPGLFEPESGSPSADGKDWSGLPVVFDEVFAGLYRLGRFSAASFLGVQPDISCHAKLLTGGLVPLCATVASDPIFASFTSDDTADALLHGHSYTAHPIGCSVAVESLKQMSAMDARGDWDWAKSSWCSTESAGPPVESSSSPAAGATDQVWSVWPLDFVDWVSRQEETVSGVWALGSVLAIHMRAADGGGYKSTAAGALRDALVRGTGPEADGEGRRWNMHARVLGSVCYVMASQKTSPGEIRAITDMLRASLG